MIHPLFRTALRRPDLIAAHAAHSVELVKAQMSATGSSLAVRAAGAALALALALVAILLALGLTAVAVMLGYLQGYHPVLLVVPGVAWALAAVGTLLALRSKLRARVDEVKGEIHSDLEIMRLVKAAHHG